MVCGGEVVKNSRRKVAARQTGDEDVQHDGAVRCSLHKVDCCVVKAAPVVEGALGDVLPVLGAPFGGPCSWRVLAQMLRRCCPPILDVR